MHPQKTTAFSSDGTYFAFINEKDNLLVYETTSNKLINCNFVWSVNACSCLRWIPVQHKNNNTKKARLSQDYFFEENMVAAANVKGDILIYNIITKNLFLHLTGRHHGAINDMCLYKKSNTFFTCSSDQHIAIWNITTGVLLSKWKADESSISSICVIDDENLLSSSTAILWWNISTKTILKKFSGHMTEIIKLLPVNVDSMKSYFLSAAVDDTKINAWSLTSTASEAFIASFSLPLSPEGMDISKVSSKDKPLMLSAVTKDGRLHIFEHILNGNISEFVKPNLSVEIDPECGDFSLLSVKLLDDADECVIAYGSSKSTIAFKHVKIKQLLQNSEKENAISVISESSLINYSSKAEKNPPFNGINDSVLSSYKSKLRSSSKFSLSVPNFTNPTEKEVSAASQPIVNLDAPKSAVDALLEAIEAQNDNIIEAIFKNSDPEYISTFIKSLPNSRLKLVLNELNHRLLQKYSVTLCRWLKEILQVHLRYLSQCDDTVESLSQTRKLLSSMNVCKTLHKMTVLQGLLNLQTQDSSSDESDSKDEESIDL